MSNQRPEKTDQELWRSLATGRDVAPGPVSTISEDDLAAWLEGRLSEAQAAHIDRAISRDPELRSAAFELSEILGQPLPAAPQRLIVRAQALVGFEAERRAPRRGFSSFLAPWLSTGFGLQRAGMASMAIVLAIMGFMMGGGLGESYAHERQGNLVRPASTDTLSEIGDLFNDGT